MLQNAYFLAKIGADTAENEQHFAEILPKTGNYPTGPPARVDPAPPGPVPRPPPVPPRLPTAHGVVGHCGAPLALADDSKAHQLQ